MGFDTRRPPLPAPTESMDETSGPDTEVATNLTTHTNKTSYSIPEDGSPITISTKKINARKEGGLDRHHGRQKSQTSLLIEYFEASKTSDKSKSRPSVRVKVTPSSNKKSRSGSDSVQITGIGSDRKPSYTHRIPLGKTNIESDHSPLEGTELSHSSGSNMSSRPPVEIEVLDNRSDLSNNRSSRGLMYAPVDSNVSSMPPDSMLEGSHLTEESHSRSLSRDDDVTIKDADFLQAPARDRARSASQERLVQMAMEKLKAEKPRKSSRSRRERSSRDTDYDDEYKERKRHPSNTHRSRDHLKDDAESSQMSSNITGSQISYRSGTSNASRISSNNPKLLAVVEDTIKRMILPEIESIKKDQKQGRNLDSFEKGKRTSTSTSEYEGGNLERRVSKSSSSPNFASKPKVVLNRDGDDPGTVLSRGDSERVKHRKSSREDRHRSSSRQSSGRYSQGVSYEDDYRTRHQSHAGREALAAAAVGGALTAAALKHHDSQSDVHERRKQRSKSRGSRSRSASITEATNEPYANRNAIPPFPLASRINDSEVTRESILSQETERPHSRTSAETHTPVREVSRVPVGGALSPASSRTPTRTPVFRAMDDARTQRSDTSLGSPSDSNSKSRSKNAISGISRNMEDRHIDADGYGSPVSQRRIGSPAQSVSSLKKTFEEHALVPQGLRPRSAASRSSAGRMHNLQTSQSSLRSSESLAPADLARSRQASRDVSGDEFTTPMEHSHADIAREDALTPSNQASYEWFGQHEASDRYRDSVGESNRDSYQTNPYPQDERRFTTYTDESLDRQTEQNAYLGDNSVHSVTAKKSVGHLTSTPLGVESAVASLMEPSTVSSNMISSNGSPTKQNASYSDRMAEHLRTTGNESPAIYEGSTMSQTMPSQARWAALKGHARNLSGSVDNMGSVDSPRQSPVKDERPSYSGEEQPRMVASGLPVADDPLPEIGHYESKSSLTTNPSIIHGPLGGDPTGKDSWPYTPDPARGEETRETPSLQNGQHEFAGDAIAGAALAGATAATAHQSGNEHERFTPDLGRNRKIDVDREATPTGSPPAFRDEGYVTDARTRPVKAASSTEEPMYGKRELEEYAAAMNAHDDDPFTAVKHGRHVSINSHGMSSPLYDGAMGKGLDRIQSNEVKYLLDHLAVRDGQRSARDTELLVTLARLMADLNQNHAEIVQMMNDNGKMVLQNNDRNTAQIHKAINGPRPEPISSPRASRRQSEEDLETKPRNRLRRYFKGLGGVGGGKGNDLTNIETLCRQILSEVQDIRQHQQSGSRPASAAFDDDGLRSYEDLRAMRPDASGYEPEGDAGTPGTPSSPSQSGHFPGQASAKQQFHSGYDGRRGSPTRVSTVLEDDEDELEPHESHILANQFENNERMLTPTQELYRQHGASPNDTPSQQNAAHATPDKQRKHKSTSSSILGIPKISRWSKTTASSAAPDPATLDSPNLASPTQARNMRPSPQASRSGSAIGRYDDDKYGDHEDGRLRSTQSLDREQDPTPMRAETRSIRSQTSKINRTPSPLIPSEASSDGRDIYGDDGKPSPMDEDERASFEDPKYQAHRNSLLLEHPQPRQGPTGRHQTALETQAQTFDDVTPTNSDLSQRTGSDFDPAVWGSSGTAGLARHRLSNYEPVSPVSMSSPSGGYGKRSKDDGPLVPQQKPNEPYKAQYEPEPGYDWEPQYSNSGFSKGGYYSSPYGSGHLLEPIEEVRYSLETDRSSHRDQSFSPEPQVAQAIDLRTPTSHKITGPRPMGVRSPKPNEAARLVDSHGAGTVRRKPIPGSQDSLDSFESETF